MPAHVFVRPRDTARLLSIVAIVSRTKRRQRVAHSCVRVRPVWRSKVCEEKRQTAKIVSEIQPLGEQIAQQGGADQQKTEARQKRREAGEVTLQCVGTILRGERAQASDKPASACPLLGTRHATSSLQPNARPRVSKHCSFQSVVLALRSWNPCSPRSVRDGRSIVDNVAVTQLRSQTAFASELLLVSTTCWGPAPFCDSRHGARARSPLKRAATLCGESMKIDTELTQAQGIRFHHVQGSWPGSAEESIRDYPNFRRWAHSRRLRSG